ncbi:hypothetical protein Clacol_009147 [Clathrus columnatus]|uniref:Beta-mannosidase n=1 Tax=Clathrus columnatus TaxID=1419009 RepID=A0AAV5AQC0_9AGAM|nr:hypothetical protein Clacol_009147 [Clathrus columnatus]
MSTHTINLNSGWYWKERNTSILDVIDELKSDRQHEWNPVVGSLPTEVHVQLLKTRKIPDPYVGFNEHKVQWIGEREWLFTTEFVYSPVNRSPHAQLVFQGLDTICEVNLDVETLLPQNTLLLHFFSAKLCAKDIERKLGRVRAGSCNLGDPSRVYVRKAQYDWRWDWGPELMTVGPWRPILLKQFTTMLSSVQTKAFVEADNTTKLYLDVDLAGNLSKGLSLQVKLLDQNGHCIKEDTQQLFSSANAMLYFGHFHLDLLTSGGRLDMADNLLDSVSKRIGFRRVQLIQKALEGSDRYGKGTTFFFKVRLWGGGVYEPDIFYDVCDELGILVWQDFQFSCGVYPAHKEFVDSVRIEAEENVKRLRHHPSIVLLCGNNEDYQQVLQWGGIDELPARVIYEEVLPEVVSRFTAPPIPYWRGSPYGGIGWDTTDPTIGDVHQWNIWAGSHQLYQDYDIMGGRFVSEFGIPSFPDWKTIKYWMADADENQWYSQSKLMVQHDKAGSHERRFAILMNENFRITSDFEKYVYLTWLMQSEGVGHAYRSWRREWRGEGKEFASVHIALCHSTKRYTIVRGCPRMATERLLAGDLMLRPKPVYYTISRELQPLAVGILRIVEKNRETDRPRQFYEFGAFQSVKATVQVWAMNSKPFAVKVLLNLGFYDLYTSKQYIKDYPINLEPNQTTECLSIPVLDPETGEPMDKPNSSARSYSVIVWAKLIDSTTGEVLARFSDWPQPYKFLDFPNPGLRVTRTGTDILWVEVENPVKGLWFSVEGTDKIIWSDNNLDLVPGDRIKIRAEGLKDTEKLNVAYLGKENPSTLEDQ